MMNSCDFNYADLLERHAGIHRHIPALIEVSDVVSHEELHYRCLKLARSLQHMGLKPGDRLAVLAPNCLQIVELLGAAAFCGVVLVLLNTRASAAEIEVTVADSGAQHIFVDAELQHLIVGLPQSLTCFSLASASQRLLAWPASQDEAGFTPPPVHAAQPLVGIPTAAVEGRSRIALLSHAALMHQALQFGVRLSLNEQDRHLCVLPLFHMAGLGLSLAVQLFGGASVVLRRFDAAVAVDSIQAHAISCFTSFSPMLDSMLDAADAQQAGLTSLRVVMGLESPQAVDRLIARCPQVQFWSGYGQTETGGIVSLSPATERPGSAGRPLAQVALRVESPDGTVAGVNEPGEILVRSPGVFNGYWQLPEAGARASRNSWHHTGDIGRIDADGYLWYLGRTSEKALIKSGGENIYPAEVEQALLAHPAVAQARVIGIPDENWGEAVQALCVLHPGAKVEEQELIDFVGSRIARFKRPKEVLFVEALT